MTCCLWNGANAPRVIKGRHDEDCADREACRGCQPCTLGHCRCCGREHVEGVQACPVCAGDARDDLGSIVTLCGALRAEARNKGVESEAMALLAPAADPEAWGHITTSLHVGRLPVGYLRCDRCINPYPCEKHADDEVHPLFVLGTWEFVWRDALDQETDAQVTIAGAAAYLDQHLTRMAGFEDAPFEDFARDLRRCRAHLELVLHDGEQIEQGAPCLNCENVRQQRIYRGRELPWSTKDEPRHAAEDGWACPRCRRWSNSGQYTLAVTQEHRERADWLTDTDMALRVPSVKASTVRSWARDREGVILVRKRRDSGRTLYSVADVRRVAAAKGWAVPDEVEEGVGDERIGA